MKNQYFADKRDFLKYDLLLELLDALPEIGSLTSFLMLTENDQTNEGKFKDYPVGNRRKYLHEFLKSCVENRSFDTRNLRRFFSERGVTYFPYHDDRFFSEENRVAYFNDIPTRQLNGGLIFFDPDIGLETGSQSYRRRKGPEKYLLWAEWAGVTHRVQGSSAFIIYQHLQRNKNRILIDLTAKATSMAREGKLNSVVFLHDNDVAFLIGSPRAHIHNAITRVARNYTNRHEDLVFGEVGYP